MDPRFVMARTYDALGRAGIAHAEFEAEINNCTGPDNAIEICQKWLKIASDKVSA